MTQVWYNRWTTQNSWLNLALLLLNFAFSYNINWVNINSLPNIWRDTSLNWIILRNALPRGKVSIRNAIQRFLVSHLHLSERNFWDCWSSRAGFGSLAIEGLDFHFRWVWTKNEVTLVEIGPEQLLSLWLDRCWGKMALLVVLSHEIKMLLAAHIGVRGARASRIVVQWTCWHLVILSWLAAACYNLRNVLIVPIRSLQDDKWASTMARELREGCQKVLDLLSLLVPSRDSSKSIRVNVKEKILRLDQGVGFISAGLKDMVKSYHDTLLHQVIWAILNK